MCIYSKISVNKPWLNANYEAYTKPAGPKILPFEKGFQCVLLSYLCKGYRKKYKILFFTLFRETFYLDWLWIYGNQRLRVVLLCEKKRIFIEVIWRCTIFLLDLFYFYSIFNIVKMCIMCCEESRVVMDIIKIMLF